MSKVGDYLSLVKFSHTIFAMPFALLAFVYAVKISPEILINSGAEWWVMLLVKVVLCMVFARNVAMGFNRWADRFIDAENPRTAMREIPAGKITSREAVWFIVINAVLFIIVSATINALCGWLSPVALAVVMFYSYCKRFTSLAHIVLGISLGIAPVGATIAVCGEITVESLVLALGVMCWSAGFDIIYALQDAEFDRERGLCSIPSRYSAFTSLVISALLHVVSVSMIVVYTLYQPQSWLVWLGCALFASILVLEHILVTPTRQRNIGIAFGTLNALASVAYGVTLILNLLIFG